ncbi:hypothetical protein VNI00_001709 [Paramarasmius palmivorus]|uniref:Uncharacterized protein n=1 Tax=Paramarasmius palmivorus TaxID=297713 RepID=A0AAW0E3B2_9AGAR
MSTINDLAVSMLDMDDDSRSSQIYDSVHGRITPDDEFYEDDDEDDQSIPRMSYLGPKMRYHSRAPWEAGEALEEAEEESTVNENHSVLSSSTNRVKAGLTRHFGFGGSKSNGTGRSSEESNGSQKASKLSFDSTSSHVSYSRDTHSYASVHQLSPSTSHIHSTYGGSQKHPYPSSRARPHSPSPHVSPTSPRSPTTHFPEIPSSGIDSSNDSSTRSSSSFELDSKPSFNYHSEETHPYANPDLVISSSSSEEAFAIQRPYKPSLSRSDSSTIGTETLISHSAPNAYPRPSLALDPTPKSPSAMSFRGQGKEISSPISVRGSSWRGSDHLSEGTSLPQPQLSSLPGWTERAASPGFNLISLEEARAQRSRSMTSHHPSTSNLSVVSSGASNVFPFPEDGGNGSGSSVASMTARARARSISAGNRAKQALNNIVSTSAPKFERRESEPSVAASCSNPTQSGINSAGGPPGGRTLRTKRSGFLRLFNGRDERSPPPPVPPLSEGFAAFNAQQASLQKPTISSKLNSHRIPVPQISPSLLSESTSSNTSDDYLNVKSTAIGAGPKRTPPPLSLHTSNHRPGGLHPQSIHDAAKSAPAHLTEFPALRLRPVSSMFSAQFGDHILSGPPSPETPSSATSPNTALSPLTPGPYSRPDNYGALLGEKPSVSVSDSEDQGVVCKLQEQLSKSKLAFQQQIWDLEGQVRDLKIELEDVRSNGLTDQPYCEHCGRGNRSDGDGVSGSIIHRPRARTGTGQSRFGSAV